MYKLNHTFKLLIYKVNFLKSKFSKLNFSQFDATQINYYKLNIGLICAFIVITIASNVVSAVRSQPVIVAKQSVEHNNSTNQKAASAVKQKRFFAGTHSKKGVIHKKNKKFFSAKEIKRLKVANSSSSEKL